jgi:hypothetical protein
MTTAIAVLPDLALTMGAGQPALLLLAKTTVLLVVALGATLVMQRASAGSRHLVWLATFCALLVLPALAAWAPWRLAILPATTASAAAAVTAPTPVADAPHHGGAHAIGAGLVTPTPAASPAIDAAATTPPAAPTLLAHVTAHSPARLLLLAWGSSRSASSPGSRTARWPSGASCATRVRSTAPTGETRSSRSPTASGSTTPRASS